MCSTQCRSGQQANEHEHYPINAIIKLYILSSEQEGGPPSNEGHYTFRGNQRKGKISVGESLFGDKNQWRAPPARSNPGEEYICKVCGAVNKMLVARITARAVLLTKSYLCTRAVCAVEWCIVCISLQAFSVFLCMPILYLYGRGVRAQDGQ